MISLEIGSYVLTAFYDKDGDGFYEYAGTTNMAVSILSPPPVEIIVGPIVKLLSSDLYNLRNIEVSIEQPMISIPILDYYVTAIPGLPSSIKKLAVMF